VVINPCRALSHSLTLSLILSCAHVGPTWLNSFLAATNLFFSLWAMPKSCASRCLGLALSDIYGAPLDGSGILPGVLHMKCNKRGPCLANLRQRPGIIVIRIVRSAADRTGRQPTHGLKEQSRWEWLSKQQQYSKVYSTVSQSPSLPVTQVQMNCPAIPVCRTVPVEYYYSKSHLSESLDRDGVGSLGSKVGPPKGVSSNAGGWIQVGVWVVAGRNSQ